MGPDGLFVYDSLRTGGQRHRWIACTDPAGVTSAWVAGRLFHLPSAGFPALVPAEEPTSPVPGLGWVTGEFIGYEDEQALETAMQDLDQLADVEGGLFERRLLPVVLDSGHRYLAWVYVFDEDRLPRLEREAVELPGGDWGDYLV
ncbi:MAG: gamma-glutamylcyclotransferase [Holophaga sp.]|nr:gamma-glutamylcyclotransferase [Holophaga sp.]